nr:hypothetical protein [Elizabethkingia bruuniana]
MQQLPLSSKLKYIFSIPVIISALGYFVDIYDLLLFGIVRILSLKDLGLNPDADGTFILNCQMIGLLIGGVFWGIFGDKKEGFPFCSVLSWCIHWLILPVVFFRIFLRQIWYTPMHYCVLLLV